MTSSSDGLGGPKAEADRLQHAVREIGDDGNAGGETENWAPAASNPTCSPVPSATSLEVSPASASTLASEGLAKKEGVEGLAVEQTTGRAAEQAPGKAADHAVKQAEEAKNQGEEQTAELTADRAENQAAEQATESKAEVAAEHTAEQNTERSAEQTAEPEFSHIFLSNPFTTGLKIALVSYPTSICKELARKEGAVDQTSEQASEQAANQATEQPSNRIAELTENLTAEAASAPTPAQTTAVAFKASEPAPLAPVPAVPQTSATHFALNTPAPGNSLASIVPTGLAGSNTPALVRPLTPLPVTVDQSHEMPAPPPAHASYSSEANASLPNAPSRPNSQPRPVAHDKTEEISLAQPQQLQLETQTASPPSAAVTLSDPLAKTTSISQPTMAEILLAMGHISAAAALPPPPTVTPYEVTLSGPLNDGLSGPGPINTLHQIDDDADLECFARLEFADSVFQMTTYAVIIGRDQRALVQARLDEQHAEEVKRRTEENASMSVPLPSPMKRGRRKFSKSYVSEEGGMLGPESDSDDAGRPAKRRKPSTNASSHKGSDEPQEKIISNRQYISHTPGAAAVDLRALRTNPYYIPFIGIHSPGPNIASRTKAISRKHLKIEYNAENSVFEAIPMHGNGFFCKDIHYKEGTVVLKSGDHLQIRDVDFRFIIPGVEKGCTGAPEPVQGKDVSHARSQAGMDISFDFVQRYRNEETSHSSDELSELDASPLELSDFGEDTVGKETRAEAESDKPQPKPDDVVQALQETGEGVEVTSHGTATRPELAPDSAFVMPPIPKKRGPGRPPKNGIMSKREQRLLKKQQQEVAKKMNPQPLVTEPPVKRKVGRPRKHPLPDNAQERTEKRKYKPRKPKDENETGGSDAERRAREKKEKKVRAKSPPPDLRIEDFTDEQLQKPNKNYSLLVEEALTPPGPPGLTLKQIYNRISVRNPWFYFFAETKGWESSVRHNLIGNEAFKKDEKSGQWYRVLGVELDAGKKRKAPSPDHILSAQVHGPNSFPLSTAQLVPAPGGSGYPPGQMVPAAYNPSDFASQPGPPAQQVQQHGGSVPLTGQGNRPGPIRPPALTHAPGYGPLPAPALAPLAGPQTGTYSSPYASQPPPPAEPSVQTEGNTIPSTTALAPTVPPPPAPPPPGPNGLSADLQNQQPPAATTARMTAGPAQIREAPAVALRAAPSLPTPLKPVIEPGLLTFILGVKRSLISSVEKTNNPKSQAIIMSALNLYIGLKKEVTEDDKTAHTLIKGVASVIQAYYSRQNVAAPAPTSTFAETPLPPIICDVNVLGLLVSFKNASIRTLKERFGDSQAEMITLSAIDRVLGLATMSIMPRPALGEPVVANCESYEQNLMGSLCTLLSNMQYEPADAK